MSTDLFFNIAHYQYNGGVYRGKVIKKLDDVKSLTSILPDLTVTVTSKQGNITTSIQTVVNSRTKTYSFSMGDMILIDQDQDIRIVPAAKVAEVQHLDSKEYEIKLKREIVTFDTIKDRWQKELNLEIAKRVNETTVTYGGDK